MRCLKKKKKKKDSLSHNDELNALQYESISVYVMLHSEAKPTVLLAFSPERMAMQSKCFESKEQKRILCLQ